MCSAQTSWTTRFSGSGHPQGNRKNTATFNRRTRTRLRLVCRFSLATRNQSADALNRRRLSQVADVNCVSEPRQ